MVRVPQIFWVVGEAVFVVSIILKQRKSSNIYVYIYFELLKLTKITWNALRCYLIIQEKNQIYKTLIIWNKYILWGSLVFLIYDMIIETY